jgi:hypothetical protein
MWSDGGEVTAVLWADWLVSSVYLKPSALTGGICWVKKLLLQKNNYHAIMRLLSS